MEISIPSGMILSGIIFVAITQALTLYRVGLLEKKFDNGVNARMERIEKHCIEMHRKSI